MKIPIEVAWATPACQKILPLEVNIGTTLHEAILQSHILDLFPDINLQALSIGIFGESRKGDDIVQSGDRIEIYRPLVMDPKEARRRRARYKK